MKQIVRRSYNSLHSKVFLNKKTGALTKLDDSRWFIKNYKGKCQYYLQMSDAFYQAMPEKCFLSTIENTRLYDKDKMLNEVKQFETEEKIHVS